MKPNTKIIASAILAGVAIGVGMGILFSPDKGVKTRGKLKMGFGKAKNNFKQKFDSVTDEWKHKFSLSNFDLNETYNALLSNMSHKTDEVILFLEDKLADLKRHNIKLQN